MARLVVLKSQGETLKAGYRIRLDDLKPDIHQQIIKECGLSADMEMLCDVKMEISWLKKDDPSLAV